ncbi:MAG TPA: hypothetical protein VF469_15030 [Kofleriaceae bacterium]
MRSSAVASSLVTLGLGLGLLAGCPDRSIDKVIPQQGRVEAKDIPVNVNRDLDLLFLIDDSPSMNDKQINLADNFHNFIDVLSSIPGGLPSIHIGVATSDMGTRGEDGQPPGLVVGQGDGSCSGFGKDGVMQLGGVVVNGTDKFISDLANPDGTRQRNYTGDLAKVVFPMMAKVGARGCAFEQHLAAVKRALTNPANAGFLRPTAYLGVIIIADEDDCSLQHSSLLADNSALGAVQSFRCTRFGVLCDQGGQTPDAMNQVGTKNQCHPNDTSAYLAKVTDYVKFLKGLKDDPSKVVVAGIIGTVDPFATELRPPRTNATPIPALAHSCSYVVSPTDTEVADPPIRTKFFLDQFPNRSTFTTICQKDLSGGLQQIGDLLKTALGDPCIEGKLADVDPDTAGPQYDCSVSVVTNPGQTTQKETILPLCTPQDASATNQPCWHLTVDAMACPNAPDHIVLKVEGKDNPQNPLPQDAHIRANCVTEVPPEPGA